MSQKFSIAARSKLTANISAVDTSITVEITKADLYPVADTNTSAVGTVGKDWFKIVLEDSSHNIEIVYVRTRALGVPSMTNCLRGQEGTTARAYLAGSIVGLRHTAIDLADAISFASGASAFWRSLVGLTNEALSRMALGSSVVGDAVFTAADMATARAALGAAASGGNSDINSLKQTTITDPLIATVGGTVDAITLTLSPAPTALFAGPKWWRASGANATTTPTANTAGFGAKTMVKGNNLALAAGDIPGAGAWMCSQYDATLDKEVLLNPATGVSSSSISVTQPATDSSTKIATTAFVRKFKQLAQIVTTQTGAVATGTTIIPFDDTIPQSTEGDQFMSLAITPTNASSTLEIEVTAFFSPSSNANQVMALFQDSTANALATSFQVQSPNFAAEHTIKHVMTAGTTSATTFKIRSGNSSGFLTTFNGSASVRYYGGNLASRITIKEYLP